MKNIVLKDYVMQAMTASIYVVLLLVFNFASFGLIQFRVAEVLMIFILFDKKYIIGVTLGCFVGNWLGGALWFDIIFGSIATLISGILMASLKRNIVLSLLMPAIVNGLIVGFYLTYGYDFGPLYYTMPSVFIGEFAVLFILGYPIYYSLKKNKGFMEFMKS